MEQPPAPQTPPQAFRAAGATPPEPSLVQRALAESSVCGFVVAAISGRVVDANDEFLRITGYGRAELASGVLTWQQFTPPEWMARSVAVAEEVRRTGAHAPYESEILRKDGSRVPVLIASAFAPAGGEYGVGLILDLTPHRQLQAALAVSEDRFRQFVEQSPLPTLICTPAGRITYCNPAWSRLFGAALADTAFYNALEDPELIRAGVMPLVERGFTAEAVTIPPIPYSPPGGARAGQQLWIGGIVYPVRNAAGEVEQVLVVEQDVTDQRQAQQQVRAALERLTFALEAARLGDWSWDAASDVVTMSARAAELFGVAPGPTLTWARLSELLHPDDRAEARRVVAEAVARQGEYEVSYRLPERAPGEGERWIAARGRGMYDEAGRPTGMAGIVVDVTARRRAERQLRDAEERLRLGLLAGNTGTWDWDIAANRVTWSDILYEFHGVERDEFTGSVEFFASLLHPDEQGRVAEAISRAVATGEPYAIEFRVVHRKTGEVRWLATRGVVYYDAGGNPVRMLGATSDVTARKTAELERDRLLAGEQAARALAERALAEAESAGRAKDDFLATLSHELRTPLSAILGYAQLLRAGPVDAEELGHGLAVIERNARAQAQIIEDLLDMSRIIAGKVRLEPNPIDLADVVRNALDTLGPTASAKGVTIDAAAAAVAGGGVVMVNGDAARLQQVFWNLLSNAVKFTPAGGRVGVGLAAEGAEAVVSVADTGVGVTPDFLPYVFDRFRQADGSTTRRHGGLGLGLAIVKHLVEMHGGTVTAASAGRGLGATFTVRLPRLTARAGDPAAHGPAPFAVPARERPPRAAGKLGQLRVLVVDDEADARNWVAHLLGARGMAVRAAPGGAAALDLLAAAPFDVLVCDIGMPEMDGYELIRRVRALAPDVHANARIPAIALTAFARAEDRTRALLAGFRLHLPKPIDTAELLAAVSAVGG